MYRNGRAGFDLPLAHDWKRDEDAGPIDKRGVDALAQASNFSSWSDPLIIRVICVIRGDGSPRNPTLNNPRNRPHESRLTLRSRNAFRVTSTVAPVSASTAIQSGAKPNGADTRNATFVRSEIATF